jgi:hypothetical protein
MGDDPNRGTPHDIRRRTAQPERTDADAREGRRRTATPRPAARPKQDADAGSRTRRPAR